MTYGFLPFAILPLYVSIDRLDPALVAAARDLYASGRAAFIHVTLPLTMPGIVAAAILTFIPAIGDFVTPDLLGGAETTTIAKVVQELFLEGRDWPYGAALGFAADGRHHRWHARWPHRPAAARGRRAEPCIASANRLLSAYAMLVYVFLFAPIVVLIIFSLQRLEAELPVARLHARLVSHPVRQRRPARGARGDAAARPASPSSCRRCSGRCSAWRSPGSGSAAAAAAETLLLLPMVTPEIIMGLSLLVFFFQLFDASGSFAQLVFAHVTFCISYVAIVVRARAAGMNPHLEEAARDLGASALGRSGS